jgi:hypothetical protein
MSVGCGDGISVATIQTGRCDPEMHLRDSRGDPPLSVRLENLEDTYVSKPRTAVS